MTPCGRLFYSALFFFAVQSLLTSITIAKNTAAQSNPDINPRSIIPMIHPIAVRARKIEAEITMAVFLTPFTNPHIIVITPTAERISPGT